jgi:GTP cyclohydrolase I
VDTEDAVRELIVSLGLHNDENFRETHFRYAQFLKEVVWRQDEIETVLRSVLKKQFPSTYDGIVAVKDVHCYSVCPHHLLPVFFRVYAAYIPSGTNVVGVSKLARIVKILSHYPWLQEEYTTKIADVLANRIQGSRGSFVIVYGKHSCMTIRGVQQKDAEVVTSVIRGVFAKPPAGKDPRQEALQLWGLRV